ncbi:MAG: adenylate/guanylate cyclase domain-containing protein [Bacteroidota bacterium]
MRKIYCLGWLILLFTAGIFAQVPDSTSVEAISVDTINHYLDIDEQVQVWEAKDSTLGLTEILELTPEFVLTDSLNVIATDKEHALWVKFRLHNPRNTPRNLIVSDYNDNSISLGFQSDPDSGWIRHIFGHFVSSEIQKPFKMSWSVFPVYLEPGETKEVYIKHRSIGYSLASMSLSVRDRDIWRAIDRSDSNIMISLFCGVIGIMVLYNFMLFLTIRSRLYLFYALYLLCIGLLLVFAGGSINDWKYPKAYTTISLIGLGWVNIFYFLFGRGFVDTATIIPKFDVWIKRYIGLRIVLATAETVILVAIFHTDLVLAVEIVTFLVDAIFMVALVIVLLRSKNKTPLNYFFITGSSVVIIFGFTFLSLSLIFEAENEPWMVFLLAIVVEILIFSLGLGYRMRLIERQKLQAQKRLNQELSKINSAFGRFVPHEFLKTLGHDSVLDIKLGDGVERDVTVFFSDIRDYTSLSEQMTPQDNFNFLNAYLGRVGPIIQAHNGFVNQYYGDGIMALHITSALDAVNSAIAIQHIIRMYNKERVEKGRRIIRLGIGIHTGPLIMGVIGDTLRMEAGVVSDTVNTASRMEGLTKHYGCSLLVSATTFDLLESPEEFQYRYLGDVLVKGRKEPLAVYDFFEADPPKIVALKTNALADFNMGVSAYYKQDFSTAAHAFDRVLALDPKDKAAQRYLKNCQQYLLEGVPEGWTGVETVVSK